jgi:hypothetical protein
MLPLLRENRGAAKLPIWQRNAVFFGGGIHHLDEILAHLVAKPSRAGMDEQVHLVLLDTERFCGYRLKGRIYNPHFQEMISGP